MILPTFTPAPPIDPEPFEMGARPHCRCGSMAALDVETGLCRECWRAGPWAAAFLEARGLGSEAQERLRVLERENEMLRRFIEKIPRADIETALGMKLPMPPADELEARRFPRIVDASGEGGIGISVELEGPPTRKK